MDCESNTHNESETQDELFDFEGPQRLDFVCVCQNFSWQSAWLTNVGILVDGFKQMRSLWIWCIFSPRNV